MKKIKLIKIKTQALRGLTIQIEPSLYERVNKTAFDLKVTKRVLIDTAIIKLLDDIEALGVEL
ncbi:MAG: hypothetical protein RSB50_09405 [Cetobacterium sp.]